jgi:hypothetical protein
MNKQKISLVGLFPEKGRDKWCLAKINEQLFF